MKGDLYACEACYVVTAGVPKKCALCGSTKFHKITNKLSRYFL